MAKFIDALQITLKYEGGHSKDPNDPGGETFKGISRVHHPEWVGWEDLDKSSNVRPDGVANFYLKNYWVPLLLDKVADQVIATLVFDFSVNAGRGPAVKLLQKCLNVMNAKETRWNNLKVDKWIGAKTLATVNLATVYNRPTLIASYTAGRIQHYAKLCDMNENMERYYSGWVRRSVDVQIVKPLPSA